ncbi:MAG: hypothetical protein L6Q37_02265 [Bdellovibrionaceae bacterium]|nr:hypothetical protein [Pseudobdellovibrionaceae bacterium]NUM57876.1 hypothetical protein [Pseudobdellovibrionaceae bacterium]
MKKLFYLISVTLAFSVFFTACGQKDEGNKDYEVVQARQSYDRCAQLKGQAYCNTAKIGNVVSMTEFYGQSYYYNFYGYNPYLGGVPTANQLTVDQVNTYFENYVRKASKQEILSMSNRWLQMSTEIGTVNSLYYPNRTCTAWGCY